MVDYKKEFKGSGLEPHEVKLGKKLYQQYRELYPHLHKLSDIQLLEELVFLEVIQERRKKEFALIAKDEKLQEATKRAKENTYLGLLQENLDRMVSLKKDLGLFEDKQKLDAYKDFQGIVTKFKKWREENQGSRKVTCPFCSEIFFLMIRTDKYEAKKFPFFKDKILCNDELHSVYKEGLISKERYAKILGTAPDFIDFLDEEHYSQVPQKD
jgi:hypothetical protein